MPKENKKTVISISWLVLISCNSTSPEKSVHTNHCKVMLALLMLLYVQVQDQ
jgi:hypothetical protein